MTHKQNNLLGEFCPLEWHSIRNPHLSILPITPSPFKASWKGNHDKPSLLKDPLCSITLHLMTQDDQRQVQACGSHASLSLMPFSTVICPVDPFSVLHSRVPLLISYRQHLSKQRISESWCNLRYNSKQAFPLPFSTSKGDSQRAAKLSHIQIHGSKQFRGAYCSA